MLSRLIFNIIYSACRKKYVKIKPFVFHAHTYFTGVCFGYVYYALRAEAVMKFIRLRRLRQAVYKLRRLTASVIYMSCRNKFNIS